MAESPSTSNDIMDKIKALGEGADDAIDLGESAILLAGLARPGLNLDRYGQHLGRLASDVKTHFEVFMTAGANNDAGTRLAAFKRVLADDNDYRGDADTYHDVQNANIASVIDRRRGLPVALSILYITVGKRLQWDVQGLDFPGHFLCRIAHEGRRIIFDPFTSCKLMEAADLRSFLKENKGSAAELSARYYEVASNRGILLRLQNNIKYRQIDAGDYADALRTVQVMQMFAPAEYRLLLDAGVLQSRTGAIAPAIESLEAYLKHAPHGRDYQEAASLLNDLKNRPG